MTDGEDGGAGFRRLALVALLVAVWLEAFQWTVTRLFVLNFETAGPDASALLVLLLVTGWSIPAATRWPSACTTGRWFGLAVLGLGVSLATDPVVAAVGGAAAIVGLTTVLAALLSATRTGFAAGAGIGVALYGGVRVWLDTAPTFATAAGQWVLVGLVIAALGGWWLLGRVDARPTAADSTVPLAPLGVFLIVQASFLAAFGSLSTWALRPYAPTVGLGIAGALAGAWLVARPVALGRPHVVGWSVAFVASVAGLLYLDAPGLPFVFVAQSSAVVLLGAGCRGGEHRRPLVAGAELAAAQLVAIVVLFLYVSAVNWAFMPSPLDVLTRGWTAELLLLLGALLPLSVLLSAGTRPQSPPEPDADRRETLSMLGVGALGLAGLGIPGRSTPSDGPDPSAIRMLTYNVHQYFSGGDAGSYNLEALAELLDEADAHVVGLQESEGSRVTSGHVDGVRWLARRLGYHYAYGVPTGEGGYGVSLLTTWPIEDTRRVQLPTHDSPPRWLLIADLRTPDGVLPVAVTHFQIDKPGDRRAEAAEVVVDELGDRDRAIVLGDFNLTPDEPPYETLASAFTDAWTAAGHPRDAGPTAPASEPTRRIDYVWLAGDWTVHEARRLGSAAESDHLAVFAVATPE